MKTTLLVLLALAALASGRTFAANEVLSVRFAPDGSVEAVVTGTVNDLCAMRVNAPVSVTSAGSSFTVQSPNPPPLPCTILLDPPQQYEVVAHLGVLAPGAYTVTWEQPQFFTSSIVFSVPAGPLGIPSTGVLTLILLIAAVCLTLPFNHVAKRTALKDFDVS